MHFRIVYGNPHAQWLLVLAALSSGASIACLGQAPAKIRTERVDAQVEKVTVNPDDENDLIVSVEVTIRAGDQSLVIPNCAEGEDRPKGFCIAQLARANGRIVRVRKGLMATLGVEGEEKWKPVTVSPDGTESFRFGFSTRLLDVRAGEPLGVKFQVWRDAQSMRDWRSATTLSSPVFRCPSKPS